MKVLKYIIPLFVFFNTLPVFSYVLKEGNVTGIVGPFVYRTNFTDTDTGAKSPFLGDVALIVQGDISDHSALEIGLFHMHKLYFRQASGLSIVEATQLFHVTMGYRYFFNPYFSFATAFYSAYSMADPSIVHNDFPAGSELDTSARDNTEYGFDFSFQTELLHRDNSALIADVRYALSVTNKVAEKGDHYGLFLGWKFLIQEKQHSKAPEVKK
jgi:hypothetical protein